MTYDPGRDPTNPLDVNPKPREYRDNPKGGMGAGMWLGILAVLAIASFFMFGMNREAPVATNDRPAATTPSTTGSGTTAPTAPRDVTPPAPTDPAPARQ